MVFDEEVHIVEEIQLLKNSEPIKNLLLSSEVSDFCVMRQVVCLCLHVFADVVTLVSKCPQ